MTTRLGHPEDKGTCHFRPNECPRPRAGPGGNCLAHEAVAQFFPDPDECPYLLPISPDRDAFLCSPQAEPRDLHRMSPFSSQGHLPSTPPRSSHIRCAAVCGWRTIANHANLITP